MITFNVEQKTHVLKISWIKVIFFRECSTDWPHFEHKYWDGTCFVADEGSSEPDHAEYSLADPTQSELEVDSATGTAEASNFNNNGRLEPYERILAISTEPMTKPFDDTSNIQSRGQNTRRWLIFIWGTFLGTRVSLTQLNFFHFFSNRGIKS